MVRVIVWFPVGCAPDHLAPIGDISLAQAERALEGSVATDDGDSSLGYYGIAAGDVDSDGRLDLAATDFGVGARVGLSPDFEPIDFKGFAVSVALVDVLAGAGDDLLIGRRTGGVTDCYYGEELFAQVGVEVFTKGGGGMVPAATLTVIATQCSTGDPQLMRVGDTDGDGRPELGVGIDSGFYLISEIPADGAVEDLAKAKLAGPPESYEQVGVRFASGDLDGDGLWEIIASSGIYDTGYSAVVAAPPFSGAVVFDPDGSATLTGLPNPELASGGDLDGDGLHDLVAANGEVWVFSGPLAGALGPDAATATLAAHPFPETPLYEVAVAADLDGDDVDDLLAGSASDVGAQAGGVVAVWYGPVSGARTLLEADARLLGESPGDEAGAKVLGPGGVNGDGYGDIVVAATNWDGGRGAVYVLAGGRHE